MSFQSGLQCLSHVDVFVCPGLNLQTPWNDGALPCQGLRLQRPELNHQCGRLKLLLQILQELLASWPSPSGLSWSLWSQLRKGQLMSWRIKMLASALHLPARWPTDQLSDEDPRTSYSSVPFLGSLVMPLGCRLGQQLHHSIVQRRRMKLSWFLCL